MRGKVLVIEDQARWQKILSKYLREAEYFVEISPTLEQGLYLLKKNPYHFITLDLQLKNDDGYEPHSWGGWKLLDEIIKHGIKMHTGVMVITGHRGQYKELIKIKKLQVPWEMFKNEFDGQKFIEIVNRSVDLHNKHFLHDQRDVG